MKASKLRTNKGYVKRHLNIWNKSLRYNKGEQVLICQKNNKSFGQICINYIHDVTLSPAIDPSHRPALSPSLLHAIVKRGKTSERKRA